ARGRLAAQENRVGVGVGGIVAVHSEWHPACAVEIALRDDPARLQQEDQFAEAPVVEEYPKLAQLLVLENPSARKLREALANGMPRLLAEEPESRHRRAEHGQTIARHFQVQPVNGAGEI